MQHASVRREHHWKECLGQLLEASQPNRAPKAIALRPSTPNATRPRLATATAYPVQVHPESNLGRV